MQPKRILAALAVAVLGLLGGALPAPGPAHAGGWAATLLDPLPERIEPGQSYTIGLWVLQHGFHPFEGDLGSVGLKLVDDQGSTVSFEAVALPEPGHYAAALAVPHPGTWAVIGVQGFFPAYRVGTLTVPGGLSVFAVPAGLQPAETAKHWPGAIRPPELPVDPARNPFDENATAAIVPANESTVEPAAAAEQQRPAGSARSWTQLAVLAGVLVVLAAAAIFVGGRRARRRPRMRAAGEPEVIG